MRKPISTKLALGITLCCALSAGWYLFAFAKATIEEIDCLHGVRLEEILQEEMPV